MHGVSYGVFQGFGNPWVPTGSGVNTYDLLLRGVWFYSVLRKPWIGWNGLPAKIGRAIIYLSWELDSGLVGQDQIVLGYVRPESRGLVSSHHVKLCCHNPGLALGGSLRAAACAV